MKLTVVLRTAIGFAVLLVLMVVIAGTAIFSQHRTQQSVNTMTGNVLPLVQASNSVLVTTQSINRAVTQHASERSDEAMVQQAERFEAAATRYQAQFSTLRERLPEREAWQNRLAAGNSAVGSLIEDGRQQIALRQDILRRQSAYQTEAQEEATGWLQFPADMQIVDRVIEILSQNSDSTSSLVSGDTRYVRDKLDLVRTELAQAALMNDAAAIAQLQEDLTREVNNTRTRMERLAESNDIIHERLSPYFNIIERAVLAEDGILTLQLALQRDIEQSNQLLDRIAEYVNTAVGQFQALSGNIASETDRLESEISTQNQTATIAIASSFGVSLVLALVIMATLMRSIREPLKDIMSTLETIADGDLSRQVPVRNRDEFGRIGEGINTLTQRLRDVLLSISNTAERVSAVTHQVTETTRGNRDRLSTQKEQTDSVASAVAELESTAASVSSSSEETLEEVRQVHTEADTGKENMQSSLQAIEGLEHDLARASDVINTLNSESDNIGSILSVIRNIAEQTNLLALNAAIEAARAGEQGRGFAVVAEEVRDLATKTQESTEEIDRMIDALQKSSREAVAIMQRNREQSDTVVARTRSTDRSIEQILATLRQISERTHQIATAASEQRQVSADVSRNTITIADMADEVVRHAANNSKAFETLAELTAEQEQLVRQFRLT